MVLIEALKQIREIASWAERIDAVGLVLKTHLAEVFLERASADLQVVGEAIDIAREGVPQLLASTATIGASALRRSSFGDVLDAATTLVYMTLALRRQQSLPDLAIVLDSGDTEEWSTIERLVNLYRDGSQWMLRVATGRNLPVRYAALPSAEREELEAARQGLAELVVHSHFDPVFHEQLHDRQCNLRRVLDRIQYFGTLAQVDHQRLANEVGDAGPPSDHVATAFHSLVTRGAAIPTYGLVVTTPSRAILWTSQSWSAWAERYLRSSDRERMGQLEEFPRGSLGPLVASLGISAISANDFTRGNIPIELMLDPELSCLLAFTPEPSNLEQRVSRSRLQFWGGFEYSVRASYVVDDDARQLHLISRKGKNIVLEFPHFASDLPRIKGVPMPLPLTHYERWELADTAATAGASIECFSGRSSRKEFLDQAWSRCDILHLATHGESFSDFPECSHLVLGNLSGLPDCLTFADILAIDWSHLSLVFLNCCVSEVGKQTHGDDRLSIAWAFLAGGAKAVIAHRWRVSDEAAFLFAKRFYAAVLLEGATIREGFFYARQALQQIISCQNKSTWGTFVLLEPGFRVGSGQRQL